MGIDPHNHLYAFWCALPSKIDHHSLLSHATSLYNLNGQPTVHTFSTPSSCYLFPLRLIKREVMIVSTNKVVYEIGFQVEFLKYGIDYLDLYIANLFNHAACFGFSSSMSHHIIHIFNYGIIYSLDKHNERTIMIGHTFSML